jgi:hypothetical protein
VFYVELSSLLDDLATLAEPVSFSGELNIRLHRPDDTNTRRLSEMFEAYGLTCRVSGPTHDRDGTLDAVATRSDLAAPVFDPVIDVGCSDHRLVRWTSDLTKPASVYNTSTYLPWRRVDVSAFQEALRPSAICSVVNDSRDDDNEQLNALYDNEINAVADRLAPLKSVTRRYRPSSDPWHDDDCRAARRRCRRLERRVKRHSVRECGSSGTVVVLRASAAKGICFLAQHH